MNEFGIVPRLYALSQNFEVVRRVASCEKRELFYKYLAHDDQRAPYLNIH
jgi:hypothetical protein